MVASAAPAHATTTYTDTIKGYEYSATSTEGKFAGKAYGDLPGYWNAVIDHTPLAPNATITGGTFDMVTTSYVYVDGDFSGGSVVLTNPTKRCVNQYYAVNATLANVSVGSSSGGTGTFSGTLTHYRTKVFGKCVTYSASVAGSLTLSV